MPPSSVTMPDGGPVCKPAAARLHSRSPPDLPLQIATYSCIYVPLLLDAAGLLSSEARQQWRQHPAFAPWWSTIIAALLSRPFLPVHQVLPAATHLYNSHGSSSYAVVTSLATLVRVIIQPTDGYYIPGRLQEMLLALLLGEGEAASLARRIDALCEPRPDEHSLGLPPEPRPRLRLVWGDQEPGPGNPPAPHIADNGPAATAHASEHAAIDQNALLPHEPRADPLAAATAVSATALRAENQCGATAQTQLDAPATTVPDAASELDSRPGTPRHRAEQVLAATAAANSRGRVRRGARGRGRG